MQGGEGHSEPRIVVVEMEGTSRRVVADQRPPVGTTLTVGRTGDVEIGVVPVDLMLSAIAVRVRCAIGSWDVEVTNRNGAFVHGWGLPGRPARTIEWLRSPRVGLRLVGSDSRQYWVLLEQPEEKQFEIDRSPKRTNTLELPPVRPLTLAQREALHELFRDVLAWPPVVPVRRERLDAVADRLGVSISAVQARLEDARSRAEDLGLGRRVPLNDPEYLYLLVRAGFLGPGH